MTLDDYMAIGDGNAYWRLSEGVRANLLDEAIERIEDVHEQLSMVLCIKGSEQDRGSIRNALNMLLPNEKEISDE